MPFGYGVVFTNIIREQFAQTGYEWGEMAVLYPEHWIGERFGQVLKRHDVPVDVVKGNKNRASL